MTTDIALLLKDEGFEDIKIQVAGDTVFAAFENRAYRGTFRGAATAIKKIAEARSDIHQFEILLNDYKMPQLIVHASRRGAIWNVRVDREMTAAKLRLREETAIAQSTGKIDITVYPMVSLVNNKLDHLFDYAVRLAPAVATTLWTGARLTIQPVFPIAYRLDSWDSKRCIQIGNANLQQQIISNRYVFASAAAGFFFPSRLGIQAQAGIHVGRNLDVYVNGGYTYKANNGPQTGFGVIRGSRKINVMLHADYYEAYTKLQFEIQAGRFLYGDYGGRFDITRHFGEYAIGVYGILTDGEHNAGFHFAIPFGGKRQKRKAFLRLRLPEYYAMEYSMQSNSRYWIEDMGQSFVTQPDQNHAAHYWEPRFVEDYVSRILNNDFQ
ncbi:MAG: YjbH domain-containing protein [Bacteroidales bacterium]|nr:YjbH domain-containing protein [Bacteroidales bacterium]